MGPLKADKSMGNASKVSFIIRHVGQSFEFFTYIYFRNLFICATFLNKILCDEPVSLLESIRKAIKFKPQRQNTMNVTAMVLMRHFTTALLPLADQPLYSATRQTPPTLRTRVSHASAKANSPTTP